VLAKFYAVLLLPVCLVAQELPIQDGATGPLDLDAQSRFLHVAPGRFTVRVPSGPGDDPLFEDSRRIDQFSSPLIVDLQRPAAQPITGVVSLRELQHPPKQKAVRDLFEAHQYWKAHDSAKAISKLEEAIRIDPSFREAHINLGVQYARSRRVSEAVGQFHTALAIGPADAIVYSNLAWGYAALGDFRESEAFARQAVALDPGNGPAKILLRIASTH